MRKSAEQPGHFKETYIAQLETSLTQNPRGYCFYTAWLAIYVKHKSIQMPKVQNNLTFSNQFFLLSGVTLQGKSCDEIALHKDHSKLKTLWNNKKQGKIVYLNLQDSIHAIKFIPFSNKKSKGVVIRISPSLPLPVLCCEWLCVCQLRSRLYCKQRRRKKADRADDSTFSSNTVSVFLEKNRIDVRR